MAEYKSKILIIGSGPAGYSAGIYAARAGYNPLIVSGEQIGGQLTTTNEVENYPGFSDPIKGLALMDNMRRQTLNVGCQIIDDTITEVDFEHKPFICNSQKNNIYAGDCIIIATGASTKWLGIKGEDKFKGWGVSSCATCDGFFYRNKRVAVVGGGNSAAEEALFLAGLASQVTLIHRRNSLRADQILQERLFNHPKINLLWNSVVEEVVGSDEPPRVTALKIKNVMSDIVSTLPVDALFVSVGHTPNTNIFKSYLNLNQQGYILTEPFCSSATNIKGVFAAGDAVAGNLKQAVIAAASGCLAFREAEKYLAQLK